jgi:sigma-E factor negative regulatory protein RseB
VSSRLSPWRIASVVVVLGLLGSAIVTLALIDSPSRPSGRRASPGGLPIPGLAYRAQAPPSPATRSGRRARIGTGLRLLRAAAAASQSISYRGVQTTAWDDDAGTVMSVVQVWHQPGRGTLASTAGQAGGELAATPAGRHSAPSAPGQQVPPDIEPILGVSGRLLRLMQANYDVVYAGHGQAGGHLARIVEVRRPDGSLAARFWLDQATSLPLRRELFDTSARVVSEDAFINLTVGASSLASMPVPAARPWTAKLGPAGLAALRASGWPLPARLPGNLALFAADRSSAGSGAVVDLSYSDGLSVLSLFVQHGVLPAQMPGWRPVSVQGHPAYAAGSGNRSLAWSAGGYEFTLIADAPGATVSDAVAALPRQGGPGFWRRLSRGFGRMISWANPFR